MDNYNSRDYTAFLDRVRDRARKSPQRFLERNRWVEPIQVTRTRRYDQETEKAVAKLRAGMNKERETAA